MLSSRFWRFAAGGCGLLLVGCARLFPGDAAGAAGAGAPPPPLEPPRCFARGTPIATPTGERPIEQMRLGDRILSYSFELHSVVESVVTDTIEHPAHALLRIATSHGATLRVTPEHPIYAVDDDRFVPAADIRTGAHLLALTSLRSAAAVTVEPGRELSDEVATVFDLTVDRQHNYFAAGVLVHNKPRCWTNADGCEVCVSSLPMSCSPQHPPPRAGTGIPPIPRNEPGTSTPVPSTQQRKQQTGADAGDEDAG